MNDFTNLLSKEEQESLKQDRQEHEIGLGLFANEDAMNEEVSVESTPEVDDDLEQLLQFLHEDADEIVLPKAYAGKIIRSNCSMQRAQSSHWMV